MKVLLLHDVRGVGMRHEVKQVSDGYARNFLLPKKLALPADKFAMKLKRNMETSEINQVRARRTHLEKLAQETLEFRLKTGEHDQIFGSVSARDVSDSLRARGYGDIEVTDGVPIKKTGMHSVTVKLGKGVSGSVRVRVSSE